MEEDEMRYPLLPKSSDWMAKLISLQADMIYSSWVSVFSLFRSSRDDKTSVSGSVETANSNSNITSLLLKRLGLGFLSVAYVCMVLLLVLMLAVVVGVGLVRLWVEEPVFLREKLHFDYTHAHPSAVFSFDDIGSNQVPVGHTFHISLNLLMPESHFNREIGVFQLSAEVVSEKGNVIAKGSRACMLRYRSFPIRVARTFILGLPLLLGISDETQKISVVEMAKHKESSNPRSRSRAIRISLSPRVGTSSLPQIYEAEIVIHSHLPSWPKQLLHTWKWTFYVWVPLYIYLVLLMILVCCWRPLLFLYYFKATQLTTRKLEASQIMMEGDHKTEELSSVSESLLTNWRRTRSKRKAILDASEAMGSSASGISVTTQDDHVTTTVLEDHTDAADSESVCLH